jgi:hypothetical protein
MGEMSEVKTVAEAKPAPKSFLADKLPVFIAITTVILAVCATLATFKAAGFGNRTVLAQSQASDQWAFYQAKSIKETAYQVQRDALYIAMQQSAQPQLYTVKLAEFDKEIARYKGEKNDIMNDAKRLEHERDVAQSFNGKLGQALIFLQIGILMSSLASINKVHYYWYMSLGCGGAGVMLFLYTMFLTL